MMIQNSEYVDIYGIKSQKKYVIQVLSKNDFIDISMPPIIMSSTSQLKKRLLMKQNVYDLINNFKNTLLKKAPHYNLDTFYENAKGVKIVFYNSNNENARSGVRASYKYSGNIISIYSEENIDSLPHELFHMSNSHKANGFLFFGFSQHNLKTGITIGTTINEGYADLLANRYFKEIKTKSKYKLYTLIMQLVEDEIGKNTVEELFSKMNLYGLLEKAKEHNFVDQFIKVIQDADYLNDIDLVEESFTSKYKHFSSKQVLELMDEKEQEKEKIKEQERIEKQRLLIEKAERNLENSLFDLVIRLGNNKLASGKLNEGTLKKWIVDKYEELSSALIELQVNRVFQEKQDEQVIQNNLLINI